MVIESSIETNSNFDTILTIQQHQSNLHTTTIKSDCLSWKFFDDNNDTNSTHFVVRDEDLLNLTEDHFHHSPSIMSSSTTTVNSNFHQQINNNNNNNNNINNSNSNNNNTNSDVGEICGDSSINNKDRNSRTRNLLNDNRQGIENATSTTDAFNSNINNTTTKTETRTRKITRNFNNNNNNNNNMTSVVSFHLGFYGWRKKCLYLIIVGLMLLIIVNLILTLWILKVMEFSSEGMGQLKIIGGGVQLSGQALIMDLLRASAIRSRHGQPISIESSRNFSIYTRDPSGELENHIFLGHDKLECSATEFRINDSHGGNLFSVNQKEVNIGAHTLKIDGEGGAIFRESIQTPHVRAEAGRELRLESPTRQLNIVSSKGITMQSRAGGIEMTALDDIKLSSSDGSIRLDSSKIFLPNLRTAQLSSSGTSNNHDYSHRVYQLCACSNGKLFLAPPHSVCAGDDSTVCR